MRGINVESTHHSGGDPMRWRLVPKDEAKAMSNCLNNFTNSLFHGHGQMHVCILDKVVLTWVQLMVGSLNLIVGMNMTLLNASLTEAVVFGWGEWVAQQVCKWIREYQRDGNIPTNVYGTWNESVMEDEDLLAAIHDWMRDKGKYVQACNIIDFFGAAAAKQYSQLVNQAPSLCTAQQWMHRMGYNWSKERWGQFADGHKQDNMKHYQESIYIPKWLELKGQMQSWDANGEDLPQELKDREQGVVVCVINKRK
jgi:hypothetical protein